MNNLAQFTHPLYKYSKLSSCDSVAWAFLNKNKIQKIPFKFYPIKPNEIRAKVLYCGLCHTDLLMSRSAWSNDLTYPIVPGHEVIAEVSHTGDNITHLKKGDKVGFGFIRDCCGKCTYCIKGRENLCTDPHIHKATFGYYFGGFATQIQQPGKFFYKLPENINLSKAGPLLCAGITVYSPIKNIINPGDKTAVLGIGGLGHMAVQFLSKMGYDVTAFTTHMDSKDLIKNLGANKVVNAKDAHEVSKYKGKFNSIINTIPSGSIVYEYMKLCAPQGKFIQVGIPDKNDPISIPHVDLVMNELELIGSLVGSISDNKSMLKVVNENNIYPMVEEFKFEDFEKAVNYIEEGKPKFRIVINVHDFARRHNLH